MLPFIDTHAHLSMLAGRGIEPAERLTGLFAEGFGGIIDIGTMAGDLPGRIEAFSRFEKVRFSAGIWPHTEAIAGRFEQAALLETRLKAAPRPLIAALGECGLDRHRNPEEAINPGEERELFELQLGIAKRMDLPVIVHSRDAPAETAEALSGFPEVRAVIHCFSYGPAEVRTFLDMGCHISFAGNLTFKNAGNLREALALVPKDRLLLETDSPFLAPVPHRGKSAEPGMVEHVYLLAAEIRKIPVETLAEQVLQNARKFFNITI